MVCMKKTINVKYKICPLPIINMQTAIETLVVGDELTVLATDPTTKQDIPAWCRIHGHNLINIREQDHELIFTIEVGQK